jgi:hypothetical protein
LFITGAVVVLVRKTSLDIEILTQVRDTTNKPADMVYHNALETVAESSLEWENVLRTARRGVEEETGAGEDEYILLGAGGYTLDPLTTTTGKDDTMTVFEPYCMFQSLRGPRPLFAACFIGLVSETFTPRPDGSGEVKGFQWWGWRELHKELHDHPKKFSPVHPVLMKVCRDILARKLNL